MTNDSEAKPQAQPSDEEKTEPSGKTVDSTDGREWPAIVPRETPSLDHAAQVIDDLERRLAAVEKWISEHDGGVRTIPATDIGG